MGTFRNYLVSRKTQDNPAGDFTRQVRDDPEMENIEEWPQLRSYIWRKVHAEKVKETIAAAEPVWRGYRAFVLKSRRSE
jgi:hypothetical protein